MAFILAGADWSESYTADWMHPHGGSSSIAGLEDHPVVQVSWNDASAYCFWAGRRLPTEAEWELAARGTDARIFPWGDFSASGNLLNFADSRLNADFSNMDVDDGYEFTSPVGSYPEGASPYGVMDMAGNVWEWVFDYYGEAYYRSSPSSNPDGPSTGMFRGIRGGSWSNSPALNRAAYRGKADPNHSYDKIGFRCGLTP
jgi:serine/threonine-protein kinase